MRYCFSPAPGLLLLEENSISGNLNFICNTAADIFMMSDCASQGLTQEVVCNCCDKCCHDGEYCHGADFLARFDPIWEDDYTRSVYLFQDFNITR